MDIERAKRLLLEHSYGIRTEEVLTYTQGSMLTLTSGEVVKVYSSGKFYVDGPNWLTIRAILSQGK